jgi:hypothetical protein
MSSSISMWINIVVAILAAIVSGGISFTDILPADISKDIVKYSAFILSVYSVVNAVLHATSTHEQGPLLKWIKKGNSHANSR